MAGRLVLDHIRQDFPAWMNQVRAYSHRQHFHYNTRGQLSAVAHSATVARPKGQKWPTLHHEFTQPGWQQSYDWHPDGTLKRMDVSLPDCPAVWGEPDTTLLQQRQNTLGQVTERQEGMHQLLFDYDPINQLTQVEEQHPGIDTRTVHKEQVDPAGNRLPEGLDALLDNRLPFHGDRHFVYTQSRRAE